jgi:arabinogalactan endo-1,4-beta-galactosidase
MANYARFVTAGNNAVKEVSPQTKTVVHLSNGFDNALFRWNIGGLTSNGAKFDVIGMSSYPEYAPNTTVNDWSAFNSKVFANVNDMIKTYNKPVIISETGMDYRSEDNCRNMIADMIVKMRSVKNQMGLGVIYWEPQAGPGYNRGYNLGAWGANNRPTRALKGFIEKTTTSTMSVVQMQSSQMKSASVRLLSVDNSTPGIRWISTPVELFQISGKRLYKGTYKNKEMTSFTDGAYLLRSVGSLTKR